MDNPFGLPDTFVADNERGFMAETFADSLGKAGTLYRPSAAYAPWQKGKVERKIESFKAIVKKFFVQISLLRKT